MKHICPYWLGPLFAASFRRKFQNPEKMLRPYVEPGMTVLEVGPAMGFFTLPLAGLVGAEGRVVAADAQAEMLEGLGKRAAEAGCGNIVLHQCSRDSLCLDGFPESVDFTLIFWMLHEVPDSDRLIREVSGVMNTGKFLLFAEPFFHVSRAGYEKNVKIIEEAGFELIDHPKIAFSRSSLFRRR
jgi:ubiquinone/menaquinone biosynthesis C-methylase UbiE